MIVLMQIYKKYHICARFGIIGTHVMEFCPHGTRSDCMEGHVCKKLHFKKIIQMHTDETLGDCSFLNTCFHMDTCK